MVRMKLLYSITICQVVAVLYLNYPVLFPPFGEVNADDTVDKSLSGTSVQLVTQPKALTTKRPRKKKIPSSTQPEPAEEFVVTVDATKSLDALESAEVQGNQPETTDAKKLMDEVYKQNKAAQEIPESPCGTESKIKFVKSFNTTRSSHPEFYQTDDANITFIGSESNSVTKELSANNLNATSDGNTALPNASMWTPKDVVLEYDNDQGGAKAHEVTYNMLILLGEHFNMLRIQCDALIIHLQRRRTQRKYEKICNESNEPRDCQRLFKQKKLAEYEEKRAKMLDEYNKCINERVNPLPITKINYKVISSHDAIMRITRNHDPLNVMVYEKFRLKTLGFTEWLEGHALVIQELKTGQIDCLLSKLRAKVQLDKKRKRTEILQEVFVKEKIVVDGMHRNLIPPSEVMKGLSKCKTLESNIRRIQVKDIVKEVEDYLKKILRCWVWFSAGM
ncbi:hypothetical protein Tco_0087281 [Tanacetum coccineum]